MPWIVPFIPAIIGAGATIGGSLLAGHGKTTQQQTFDPATTQFRNTLMPLLLSRINQPLSLDPALLSSGVGNINKAFNAAKTGLQSDFSARGLGQSGLLGGGIQDLTKGRLGGIVQLIQQLTGTAEERQARRIDQALSLTSPTGQTTTGPGTAAGLGAGLSDLGTLFGIKAALGTPGFGGGVVNSVPGGSGSDESNLLLLQTILNSAGGGSSVPNPFSGE